MKMPPWNERFMRAQGSARIPVRQTRALRSASSSLLANGPHNPPTGPLGHGPERPEICLRSDPIGQQEQRAKTEGREFCTDELAHDIARLLRFWMLHGKPAKALKRL
jgi:hypothetical protein